MTDFKPEEIAEIVIWDWLIVKGKHIKNIYFNRENKLGWKKFRVEGLQKKPDFIIEVDYGYGPEFIAMEIKSSENSKDILNSRKIIGYFENYVQRKTIYFIEEREIKISNFIIGTENSPKGYLFFNESLIDNLATPEDKSKYYVAKIGIIPRFEGLRTFEFVRFLWNLYADIRNNFKEKCGIGILIADINNSLDPKIMITSYDINKNRWGQRFWEL